MKPAISGSSSASKIVMANSEKMSRKSVRGGRIHSYGRHPPAQRRNGCNKAAKSCEREPNSRHSFVSACFDQVCADGRCEAAEDRSRQTIRKRKAAGANVSGHEFSQINDHRSVIAAENERKPKLHSQQLAKGRAGH